MIVTETSPPLRLSAILASVATDGGVAQLVHRLAARRPGQSTISRFSVLDAAKPAVLAALHQASGRPMVVLVARLGRARQLADEVSAWLDRPDAVHIFPELDALPYERLAPGPEHLYERLRSILALTGVGRDDSQGETSAPAVGAATPAIVFVTARAAMDRIMGQEDFRASSWRVAVGDRIRPDSLVAQWVQAGYEAVSVVERPGEFARRGGIIDIFPTGGGATAENVSAGGNAPAAFRIELWENDVDSIRSIDLASQRSLEPIREITIGPAHEVQPHMTADGLQRLGDLVLDHLQPRVRDEIENELRQLAEGQSFAHLHWYRGLLGDATILDYVPSNGVLVIDEAGSLAATARELHRQAEQLAVDLLERGETPGNAPRPYWTWEELESRLTRVDAARLDLVLDPDALDTRFVPPPTFSGRLPELMHALATTGGHATTTPSDNGEVPGQLVIVSQQAARLADLFAEEGIAISGASDSQAGSSALSSPSRSIGLTTSPLPVLLVHRSLGEGWSNPVIGVTVLTDREIFGWAKVRRTVRRAGVAARERFLSDLEVDELVVHVDHGIGRYRGLVRLTDRTTGVEREYLDIEYADNGRLRVPAEHADRVTRYIGAGEAVPSLTRLGGGEWQRTKQRIRSAVQRIARELVELYATRELAEARGLGPDSPWQIELEASFPFVETADQLQAVHEVKEDLERPRPMDRLLVGDVGYGKTEVALRAAFKAVSAGHQAAILVPTTVLAQQHFNTFRERLAPFPVRVEMLSRFLTDRQAREVVQGIKDGRVDIVIGTHRLLQRDVEFNDLALVIIDEEQRFGVMHKDRFKQLRTEIHVLSLSATPIPRTLHLSLVGVRDLSMIQTPPEERLPIRTYVTEHDDRLVREAILRELDRGGQIYYVSNRVFNIATVAQRLAALVPEARIAIGHGQMGDDELEDTMVRFANGDADVLVCTTIIEAGLDLPNVNTIIVTNAHQFGLSQLYQLRGRVGRAANRAYAYFLYDRDRQLSEVAEKRLRAIFEATELGAGYRIALKDLEIRGAGNLLGVEQHGHISAVGFDLYCRLLGDAVEQLKKLREQALSATDLADHVLQGALQEWRAATVNVPVTASLPETYIADASARLNLYQRLSAVREGAVLGDLMSEIEDRFGPLPEPTTALFYLLSLRIDATTAGIDEILVDGEEFVVRFRERLAVDAVELSRALGIQVRARTNQVRFSRGHGSTWMPILRRLVDTLLTRSSTPIASGAP